MSAPEALNTLVLPRSTPWYAFVYYVASRVPCETLGPRGVHLQAAGSSTCPQALDGHPRLNEIFVSMVC